MTSGGSARLRETYPVRVNATVSKLQYASHQVVQVEGAQLGSC